MLEMAAVEYAHRTPKNYPRVIDETERGTFGIFLDPSHSLNFVSDGENVYMELTARSSRTDARASAGREKYSGMPFNDRRLVPSDISDQELRKFEGYMAEIFTAFGMDLNTPSTVETPQRFIRWLRRPD